MLRTRDALLDYLGRELDAFAFRPRFDVAPLLVERDGVLLLSGLSDVRDERLVCHDLRGVGRPFQTGPHYRKFGQSASSIGMQWNALNATGICSSSSAHRRFQEWEQAGVFAEIWRQGLLEYDQVVGIEWAWLALDGAMSKAPLGGAATGPNPTDRAKRGRNVRFSARRKGYRSGWRTTVPTGTT